MSNTTAICDSFRLDLLNGKHAFGSSVIRAATTADTFKGALYFATASLGASTTAYTSTGEVSSSGYVAGGAAVTNANAPANTGSTAYWTPSASLAWTGITIAAFDALLLYNDTAAGKNAVAVFNFGSQSLTVGNFTLTMPTNNASTGLLRIS